MNEVYFANCRFRGLTKEFVLSEEDSIKFVVTVNAEFIVKANENDFFKSIINENIATFDGQVPYALAKVQNNRYFEKISGSDLIYDFCDMAQKKNKKVFLLGGLEESNIKATKILENKYNIEINGYSPPYQSYPFSESHNKMILQEIKAFNPEILFVGFGAVKQELWIEEHKIILQEFGVRWVIGSGGTFEFVAGVIKRAPKVLQKIGLEGVWRLVSEPKLFRLKRLLISLKIFKYI